MRKGLHGATVKQWKYANGLLNTEKSKAQVAIDAGYSYNVARNVTAKVENRAGTKLAMADAYAKAGNVAVAMIHEVEAKGYKDLSFEQLLKGINTMVNVFDKLRERTIERTDKDNDLRTILVQAIQNKDITVNETVIHDVDKPVDDVDIMTDDPMDF